MNCRSILSKREIEVLRFKAQGNCNGETAASLFISERTVKQHLRNIFKKLGAKNITHAVYLAMTKNLLGDDYIMNILDFLNIRLGDIIKASDNIKNLAEGTGQTARILRDQVINRMTVNEVKKDNKG